MKKRTDDRDYALDMLSPVRFLATRLDRADEALSIRAIAPDFEPTGGDLSRIKLHENCTTDREARVWLIKEAAYELRQYVDIRDQDDGDIVVGFRDGVAFDNIRYERKKLHRLLPEPERKLRDAFSPLTGKFSDNIRRLTGKDNMTELRESMQAFGWLPEFPAIIDERGVVLVGHRRMAVAKELGIDPQTRTVRLGDGDEADAKRFALAIASNLGAKPFTPEERAEIALYLYNDRSWSQARIAEALHVSQATVSNELSATNNLPHPERGGRPKKNLELARRDELIWAAKKAGRTTDDIAAEFNVVPRLIDRVAEVKRTFEEGYRAATAALLKAEEITAETHVCTCPVCGNMHRAK